MTEKMFTVAVSGSMRQALLSENGSSWYQLGPPDYSVSGRVSKAHISHFKTHALDCTYSEKMTLAQVVVLLKDAIMVNKLVAIFHIFVDERVGADVRQIAAADFERIIRENPGISEIAERFLIAPHMSSVDVQLSGKYKLTRKFVGRLHALSPIAQRVEKAALRAIEEFDIDGVGSSSNFMSSAIVEGLFREACLYVEGSRDIDELNVFYSSCLGTKSVHSSVDIFKCWVEFLTTSDDKITILDSVTDQIKPNLFGDNPVSNVLPQSRCFEPVSHI